MANASIPSLPVAITLDGTEQLEIVQPPGSGGTTKRATTLQIAGLASLTVTASIPPIAGLSVLANSSTATQTPSAVTGTTDLVLKVNSGGTGLAFSQLNLSSTATFTGSLSSSSVNGIISVPNGGTGTSALTAGQFLLGNGTSAINVTSLVSVSLGGTGTTTLTANGVLVGAGTSSVAIALAVSTSGWVLTSNGTSAAPSFQQVTGTAALSAITGLSVLANSSSASAVPAAVTGTHDQTVIVNTAGTGLLFGQLNLSATSAITGFLSTTYFTGTITVALGGTGANTLSTGSVLIGKGTSAITSVTNVTSGWVLASTGTATIPAFSQVNLTSAVSGILPIANGGTNASVAATAIINLGGLALATTGQAFSGGVVLTTLSLGTSAGATTTLVAGNNPTQRIVSNGTGTIVAPSSDCEIDLLVTNAGSASTLTFSGYTGLSSTGDSYTTTNGSSFIFMSRTINAISTYAWKVAK